MNAQPPQKYSGLRTANIILAIAATIGYVLTGVLLVASFIIFTNHGEGLMMALPAAAGAFFLGAMLHGLAAVVEALTYIAKNTAARSGGDVHNSPPRPQYAVPGQPGRS